MKDIKKRFFKKKKDIKCMVPVCLIGFTGFKTAKPLVGDKLPLTKKFRKAPGTHILTCEG